MNKEEKIKLINTFLEHVDGTTYEYYAERYIDKEIEQNDLDAADILGYEEMFTELCNDFDDVIQTGLKIFLKLLQLPTRSIDTLNEKIKTLLEYVTDSPISENYLKLTNDELKTLHEVVVLLKEVLK